LTETPGSKVADDSFQIPEGLARSKEELIEKLKTQSTPSEERLISKCWRSSESWCDDDRNFNPAELARDIVQNSEGIKTDSTTDVLYFYDGDTGIYDRNGDAWLRRLIDHLLQSKNRQHRTTETIYLIHSKTQTPIQFSPKIALQNGLLNVKTHTLEPFTPDEFVTIKSPVRYDKSADCPTIKKFLLEVLGADQMPIAQE
jgi:phage/plasmid-associated DNA primase